MYYALLQGILLVLSKKEMWMIDTIKEDRNHPNIFCELSLLEILNLTFTFKILYKLIKSKYNFIPSS
jgi:hypothetical protein